MASLVQHRGFAVDEESAAVDRDDPGWALVRGEVSRPQRRDDDHLVDGVAGGASRSEEGRGWMMGFAGQGNHGALLVTVRGGPAAALFVRRVG